MFPLAFELEAQYFCNLQPQVLLGRLDLDVHLPQAGLHPGTGT